RQRLLERDRITPKQADSILQQQVSRQTRHQKADDLIDTSGSLHDTQQQVERLHQRYLQMAQGEHSTEHKP
ncbi:dephospho-CoA kinase, partial [Candidatus Saccharibacteria bacterium]|nr:dephospho-CoA kinase [Candidatus Saccharibacteria bacterium]